MKESLYNINPNIPKKVIDNIVSDLSQDYSSRDIIDINYKLYGYIRNSIRKTFKRDNQEITESINLIDFDNPENNTFTAVSQMWIKGRFYYRRPDVIIFINGMPLVWIEFKNGINKVKEGYTKNLLDYKRDIPNLFAFNQVCVLSNGVETRVGAFNASYDYFFEWLKADEKEKIDREAIKEQGISIEYLINSLFVKKNLIDYIENFILFENQRTKIIATNHQYLGVNNLMKNMERRDELNGKLGVFWHTQGAGKSYSMVMFARKVNRKLTGNFSFLIVTDRDDLDTQIHKNFVRTETIGRNDETQPKNSEQLRSFLQSNKPFIFTLIHKFRYDKTKKYPVLSTRNDIIVLVDEAHRTQYKDLGENMHTALPNANFIAFTGTPLLGSKRLTNQWFGDYASEYNFAESVEDGTTVPLYYSRRVPEVGLENNFLDDDIVNIIENENLNEDEQRLLENSSSRILEVIKRDSRLKKIAKDIAHHFPRRGFLGKGMVVSVDKYTAVKMYDLVNYYWPYERQELVKERNNAKTREERERADRAIKYMDNVEMAVVISEENDEVEKFKKQNLNIIPHREKMNEIVDGKDLEDRFKDPNDKLQLVFVCAMWLTGFDVKNLSTLYLDKPMKSHTLMQAIARANRVYPNKTCGLIVDYVNVFKYMREALRDYATGDDDEFPAKNIDALIDMLNSSINEADNFLKENNIDLSEKLKESNETFDNLEVLREICNKLCEKDLTKDKFKVITNTMINLYDASKPEIFERDWYDERFSALAYINGLMKHTIDDDKIERAKKRMAQVLDGSVVSEDLEVRSNPIYVIDENEKVINLSKIDFEQLKQEIKRTKYKAIEIDDMKAFIEKALYQMINKNSSRIKFSERYKNIIDRYNAGSTESEEYFEELVKLIEDMKQEQDRCTLEGLTEEELELYDLLTAGKKLTKAEEQKVKLASKNLYTKLNENRQKLLVVDWYKDEQPKVKVKNFIEDALNEDLPECYDKASFEAKTDLLLNHFIDMSVQGYGWIGNQGLAY